MKHKNSGMKKGFKYGIKKHWFNNGTIETQIFDGSPIPEGFVNGRLPKNKPAWNRGLTKDTDPRVNLISKTKMKNKNWESITQNRRETLIKNFANEKFLSFWKTHTCTECIEHFDISWKDLHILINFLDLESPKEHKKNLKDHIWDESFRKKHSELLKGKNTWSKGRKLTPEHINKQKESYSQRTEEEKVKSKQKEWKTRHKNGTDRKHITKEEQIIWNMLKNHFSEDDILYEYFDSRYPFKCDFYVKSQDLFIEVNAYPSHGGHRFDDNNLCDIEKLSEWKIKSSLHPQYNNWVYTWTDLDKRKFEVAEKEGLNYLPIYNILEAEVLLNEWLDKN